MECDRHIFLSFWTIFCPFALLWTQKIRIPPKNGKKHLKILSLYKHKWQSDDVWSLRYEACDGQNILSFWTFFSPFTPLTQKIKNILSYYGYIIILHMCTINEYHMTYGSWDNEHDRQNLVKIEQKCFLS